ncbi:hypothetical protein [Synechocystis sp. PCC 7509]|nr:hypothetical protein [Synechocystis sp. PCC 7509]
MFEPLELDFGGSKNNLSNAIALYYLIYARIINPWTYSSVG